jgi:hypothetical protein
MDNVISLKRAALAEQLPFVRHDRETDTLNLWAPERSGDYSEDSARGRAYADALVNHIATTEAFPLLGQIAQRITESGRWDGVEIGFFSGLAIATVYGK